MNRHTRIAFAVALGFATVIAQAQSPGMMHGSGGHGGHAFAVGFGGVQVTLWDVFGRAGRAHLRHDTRR